jgi:hypothetical protein
MNPLHKDDIEILDNIILTCLQKGYAGMENLPVRETNGIGDVDFIKFGSYKRLFDIIEESKQAKFNTNTFQTGRIEPIETITKRFYNSGGFKNLFAEQQEKIRVENILKESELDGAKVMKWTRKTYKLSVGIVILSFVISIIALIVAILKP